MHILQCSIIVSVSKSAYAFSWQYPSWVMWCAQKLDFSTIVIHRWAWTAPAVCCVTHVVITSTGLGTQRRDDRGFSCLCNLLLHLWNGDSFTVSNVSWRGWLQDAALSLRDWPQRSYLQNLSRCRKVTFESTVPDSWPLTRHLFQPPGYLGWYWSAILDVVFPILLWLARQYFRRWLLRLSQAVN